MATEEYSIGYDAGYQDGWNDAIDEKPKQEPVAEPHKDEPFGWYDMEHGEIRDVEWNRLKPTYEGVWRPLYTTPQPVAFKPPAKWRDDEIANGCRGIRWVAADGVYGRPTQEDVEQYLGYTTQQQRKSLSAYINSAKINANDLPHIVVEKLEKAIEAAHGIKEKNT